MAITLKSKPKAIALSLLIEQADNTENNIILHEIMQQCVEGKLEPGSSLLITVDGETTRVLLDRSLYYFPSEEEVLVVNQKKPLGKGAYGKVYPANYAMRFSKDMQTDRVVATKVDRVLKSQCIITPKGRDHVEQEVACLRLVHDGVSQVVFSETSTGEQKAHFFMERCPGVPLQKILEILPFLNFELSGLLLIALKIVETVADIHERGVIHRDLNTENIMLDLETRVVDGCRVVEGCDAAVIDFGLSSTEEARPRFIKKGLSPYKNWSGRNFLAADDIYAIAVSLEKLLAKKRGVIEKSAARSDAYAQMCEQTQKLIATMKNLDPAERPTANQLVGIFHKAYVAVFREELRLHRASSQDYEVNSANLFSGGNQRSLGDFIDLIKELINSLLGNRRAGYSCLDSETTEVASCHQSMTVTS